MPVNLPSSAARLHIDFLQRYDVRRHTLDHFRDPRQIELAVHPLAMMNVVGQHAQGYGLVTQELTASHPRQHHGEHCSDEHRSGDPQI